MAFRRQGSVTRLAGPLRGLAQRNAALGLVLLVLAVGLVLATRLLAHGSLRRPGASS